MVGPLLRTPFSMGAFTAVFAGVSLVALLGRPVYCQFGGCVSTPSGVVNPPELTPLLDTSETCTADGVAAPSTLEDESWVRSSKQIRVGARGRTYGQCDLKGWNPYPSNCQSMGTELRTINYVQIYDLQPNGVIEPPWPYFHMTNETPQGTVFLQSIDSSIVGSTTGPR